MISGQAGILAAIVIYLLAMVYVGFYFSKKGSGDSADDFYLGGRKLGPFVTAMSAEASDMSSWLLMGRQALLISPVLQTQAGPPSALALVLI